MPHVEVKVSKRIGVSKSAVWSVIEPGDGLEMWLPAITQCRLDGAGTGAIRHCTLGNGAQLKETILAIDRENGEFHYSIDEHPLPATNITGTVKVTDGGPGAAVVTWTACFDADAAAQGELEKMFQGIYSDAIDGLETYVRKS